jgi:peptide/nickel transport system permease protein
MDTSEQVNTVQSDDIEPLLELTPALSQQRRSQGRIVFERFIRNRSATIGAIFLILLFLFCFLGPIVLGHNNPDQPALLQPLAGPSLQYPFGADDLGRDLLARAAIGGRVSLLVGLASMLVAITLGTAIGAIAGYYGGLIDNILMRVTDVFLAIPTYLLLFVLSASFISNTSDIASTFSIIALISFFGWTTSARLVRGEFLTLKEREYVMAARTIGAKNLRLMIHHILPNAVGPIVVNATLLVGRNIIQESVLSYFGFGIKVPFPSWGTLINDGQGSLDIDPKLVFIPGALIFLTVLSCNLVGDGLRDALDPRMTER